MSDMTYTDTSTNTQTDLMHNLDGEADAAAAGNPASLFHNFGVASLLVVAGVVISGFLLTSEQTESSFDLPAMPTAVLVSSSAVLTTTA